MTQANMNKTKLEKNSDHVKLAVTREKSRTVGVIKMYKTLKWKYAGKSDKIRRQLIKRQTY